MRTSSTAAEITGTNSFIENPLVNKNLSDDFKPCKKSGGSCVCGECGTAFGFDDEEESLSEIPNIETFEDGNFLCDNCGENYTNWQHNDVAFCVYCIRELDRNGELEK